ncbi:unnamed protein product [Psylliodes chrysocephalus]|uniref:Uncharacterized protein n=1 Tax=Psylliodes chrysocephalus TaxID=3402493 RepID=A0A9P0D6J6_9CUCU|nr:unnamed protein product [Psylliodes chrysocephala]
MHRRCSFILYSGNNEYVTWMLFLLENCFTNSFKCPNVKQNIDGFQYIVKTKKEDRICFGTIVPRSTSPIGKGLTTYQKIQMPEIFPKTGPGCYNTEKNTSLNLKLNKKIRNCFFMHEHQNTNAAIKILPLRKVRKKIELENYLTYYNELIEC